MLEQIGGGGMGVVFKAEDTRLGRQVALKFLPDELARDSQAVERFKAGGAGRFRAEPPAHLHHSRRRRGPGAAVHRHGVGRSWSSWRSTSPTGWRPRTARASSTATIKPANIFVTDRGQAKILDFGLAKLLESRRSAEAPVDSAMETGHFETTTGSTLGTIAYMSPEQARGEEMDARTDLFSFGVVLYEMATGQAAFAGGATASVFERILNQDPKPVVDINRA